MPVKAEPKERPIVRMLLSACDTGAWQGAHLDWVEEKQDGAVELIATTVDGKTLALEHTLIQPFVGEKFDSEIFMRAFGRIEKNPALVLPERNLDVIIPVHAIPKGYDWDKVGQDLLAWLLANHASAPHDGEAPYIVPVASNAKNGPLPLRITLRTMYIPGIPGSCLIARDRMPGDLHSIVEKALRTKIPKLVGTPADKRILLLERDQIGLGDGQVYSEIVKLTTKFPDLARVDEIWIANTSILASERWASFTLMDGRGLVELLTFENAMLKTRRDDRPHLGPPHRDFCTSPNLNNALAGSIDGIDQQAPQRQPGTGTSNDDAAASEHLRQGAACTMYRPEPDVAAVINPLPEQVEYRLKRAFAEGPRPTLRGLDERARR